jgi:hypothetical protein
MQQAVFHGILVDAAFTDRLYPETFSVFARKNAGLWGLYGIEIPRENIKYAVRDIQLHMRADESFYSHLYDDEAIIVIFKQRIFLATPNSSSWKEIQNYGLTLGIPLEQLDFWPCRFQDEVHYFEGKDGSLPPNKTQNP